MQSTPVVHFSAYKYLHFKCHFNCHTIALEKSFHIYAYFTTGMQPLCENILLQMELLSVKREQVFPLN